MFLSTRGIPAQSFPAPLALTPVSSSTLSVTALSGAALEALVVVEATPELPRRPKASLIDLDRSSDGRHPREPVTTG
jgi:hypothetical protein